MKLRIVRRQRIGTGGDVYERFTVQEKGWWFWWTLRAYRGCYAGGTYEDITFKTYAEAEAFVAARCETHRKWLASLRTIQPRTVVAEVECE
jgi:hypothetical protein